MTKQLLQDALLKVTRGASSSSALSVEQEAEILALTEHMPANDRYECLRDLERQFVVSPVMSAFIASLAVTRRPVPPMPHRPTADEPQVQVNWLRLPD